MYRATTETAAAGPAPRRPIRDVSPGWIVALVLVLLAATGLRVAHATDPERPQEPDSIGYARIAVSLHEGDGFGLGGYREDVQDASNYSPGLPLLVAGIYEVTGGDHLELVRVILALVGALGALFAFLIGWRLSGPAAGLVAAIVVAGYPALLEYQGMLMTEPLAVTLLGAALLAFLWAGDRLGPWPWALPGALFGLLALVRPEYLPVGVLLALVAFLRVRWLDGGWAPGLAAGAVMLAAFLLPIVPWTVRNAVELDRFVPISTGGGKALFVGTYLPADGDGPRLREELLRRDPELRRRLADRPRSVKLDTALSELAANSHPGKPTDVALSRLGRDNLDRYVSDDPLGFAAMLARKSWRAWREGTRPVMHSAGWKAAQKVLVALALLGLVVLAARRRWEAIPAALLVIAMTATAALLIASPRRVIVILPLVGALAGYALGSAADFVRARRSPG